MQERYGIRREGYLSLPTLLANTPVDIAAICSPAEVHLHDLEVAAEAGCHVFCEKPMWWSRPNSRSTVGHAPKFASVLLALVDRYTQKGRFLALNTQWPFTLPAFRELHPGAHSEGRPVRSFSMWLSPASRGYPMVVDAAPHLLSMLQALLGPGQLQDIDTEFQHLPDLGAHAHGLISLDYMHDKGETGVTFKLSRCLETSKPAGYAINGAFVERHLEPSKLHDII
ncbi:MAG: Gfo/Idh/MocA family oxidoreductase [Acidiferrobacterales bacterium]